jgi:hypothetical protein
MIITYTFGFDERFAFRSLLRRGLGGSDKVAVLVPSNRPDEKSENALSSKINFKIFSRGVTSSKAYSMEACKETPGAWAS